MSFIKHHKKFVALFVVLSFLYLVEISYLPLRAEPAAVKAPVSMNGDDQTPGSIEQEGGGYVHKKKSSPILPIIIGVVVLGAVAAVLILVVFKTKYELPGTWSSTAYFSTINFTVNSIITFTATTKNKNGTYTSSIPSGDNGNWTQDKKHVSLISSVYYCDYDGNFTSKNTISGACTITFNDDVTRTGTWIATKTSSASAPRQEVISTTGIQIQKKKN